MAEEEREQKRADMEPSTSASHISTILL